MSNAAGLLDYSNEYSDLTVEQHADVSLGPLLTIEKESGWVEVLSGGQEEIIIVGDGEKPGWYRDSVRALSKLLLLPEGWDSHDAPRIELSSVLSTLTTLENIVEVDTPTPAIVPTCSGGIQIEWHRSGIDLEVTINPGKKPHFYAECDGQEEEWKGIESDWTEHFVSRL